MNKQEIVESLAKYLSLTQTEIQEALEFIVNKFEHKLKNGERIYLRNFGSLQKVKRNKTRIRDINSGKLKTIPEHYTVEFRPSSALKEKINK
ncbi:MAG: HU family DNA-binding protein [Atribacterota bacterium]